MLLIVVLMSHQIEERGRAYRPPGAWGSLHGSNVTSSIGIDEMKRLFQSSCKYGMRRGQALQMPLSKVLWKGLLSLTIRFGISDYRT